MPVDQPFLIKHFVEPNQRSQKLPSGRAGLVVSRIITTILIARQGPLAI
jgi:hypothetical protein